MNRKPPQHLDDQARVKWSAVLPILKRRGNIDQGTLDALAAYCQAWSRWTAAEQPVNTLGAVVKSPAGFAVPNPYLAVAKDAQRQMRQWGDVLGLHKRPSQRKPEQAESEDGGDGLLKLLGHNRAAG
jgi:P27 family predicted phage terminase small subunit